MKFYIKHEIKGRIRIHLAKQKLTSREADFALYYFGGLPGVEKVKVYERTAGVAICYRETGRN